MANVVRDPREHPDAIIPDLHTNTVAPFTIDQYPSDNAQRPTGPTCDGCHSVAYNVQTKNPAEWNVGCENCHGPGRDHVAQPARGNIFNASHMDSVASTHTCIQCHSQEQPRNGLIDGKAYDWPVGYRVGLPLREYWKLEQATLGQTTFTHFPDGPPTRIGCRATTSSRA